MQLGPWRISTGETHNTGRTKTSLGVGGRELSREGQNKLFMSYASLGTDPYPKEHGGTTAQHQYHERKEQLQLGLSSIHVLYRGKVSTSPSKDPAVVLTHGPIAFQERPRLVVMSGNTTRRRLI